MDRMKKHSQQFGVEVINDHINEVDLSSRPFVLKGTNSYTCDSLIISTGASAMYLGLPSEQKFLEEVFPHVLLVMDFFIKIKKLLLLGEEIQPWKKLYICQNMFKSISCA